MIIKFIRDEITLKTTLLVWEPMVTSNGLVSSMIVPKVKFRPSMTSTNIGVLFSTRVNLYCHTNSLIIKHADALKSISVWASIITSLLHFTMIGMKKHGVRSKNRLGSFSLHDASRSNLAVPIKTRHARFPTPLI